MIDDELRCLIAIKGFDSPGNDIEQVSEVSTATGLIDFINGKYQFDNKIAAFNANGWVKSKINYPITRNTGARSLDGLYIRTKFRLLFLPQSRFSQE